MVTARLAALVVRLELRLADVARQAGVSTGTVSNVLNRPESVADATRTRVLNVIAKIGYVAGAPSGSLAAHWRRNNFSGRVFGPAATGRLDSVPVPLAGEPWPGRPVRGRGATDRADACWAPIAPGLTPHGLRHSYKTLMDELGVPSKLKDQQMGHSDGSVQAVYSHVTDTMVGRLIGGLTEAWHDALDERARMAPGSPVPVLDRLLAARPGAGEP